MTQQRQTGEAAEAAGTTTLAGGFTADRDSQASAPSLDTHENESVGPHIDVGLAPDSFGAHSLALIRAAGSGSIAAAVSSTVYMLLKRRPPLYGWRWHVAAASTGTAFGWWYTRWKQRIRAVAENGHQRHGIHGRSPSVAHPVLKKASCSTVASITLDPGGSPYRSHAQDGRGLDEPLKRLGLDVLLLVGKLES
ncbi:hypothetical protein BESB_026380 [Besnoitia besnoiti]|uniref:Transmembrane protein n=1 Tax=Besnoitia besnoiti TaxID=94643 RepID=A0A2A9M367_BESBE|nr:uncharacterized protein BESB_026380 [Besnoitia besnoiti]PFH31664.1 hypothetical protein BESB_026380 [Besnoitia besnoiti]